MAEEEQKHGLAHGHDHNKHADQNKAVYWGLGIGAAALVVTLIMLSKQQQPTQKGQQGYLVHETTPFIPNPSDVSIGHIENIGAPLYWPGLPTSGTPHKPKTHHDTSPKPKKKTVHKPTSHKKYGKSPQGASHGHTVTHHTHNPKTIDQKTKGTTVNG